MLARSHASPTCNTILLPDAPYPYGVGDAGRMVDNQLGALAVLADDLSLSVLPTNRVLQQI